MTVSYTAEVAHSTWFGCFPKLLLRWRASIYKLIWVDVLTYIGIYYAINGTYRFLLNADQKKTFEVFVKYCNTSSALIPLMFVLGFYVSIVIKRWWEQYMTLPWPDSTAVYVSSLIRGQDENGRKMRRTIMRYVCLSLTMVLTMISPRVKKRFPTLDHLVDVGLLVENEKVILKNMNEKFAKHPKHWMPIVWASSIVTRARKEGRIRDDSSLKTLIDSLNSFRGMCMVLLFYDTISIPLVYTQVVTIAVYSYLLTSVFGHQWTGETDDKGMMNIVDYFFPFFTVLEYLFFMGWLKVAESLICPFGDDDDDFEVNWLIDRNLQVSYLIVDEMHNEHPELIKDQYWDEVFPAKMPYKTDGIIKIPEDPPLHSTAELDKKNTTSRVQILQSVTRFFSKHCNREETYRLDVTENLHKSDSRLSQSSEISQKIPSTLSGQNLNKTEALNLIPIVSVMSDFKEGYYLKASEDDDEVDDFEKLKKQRQQERLQRQKTQFNLKDQSEKADDLKSTTSRISRVSQGKKSKKSSSSKSSIANSSESKKSV
ncbi:bestrophin-4-like [Lucilia sericata]|uniref:bestrophin-4-like n=1 Tax=Lucilia sericata TaxID=13632 RepID=UPI0018A82216|nr:bestrophin-4-like [Lucilia sericata]